MRSLFHTLKNIWMAFARAIGRVNTIIILTVFYFVILAPFGLIARLKAKFAAKDEGWIALPEEEATLELLRRPF